ncbi:hypothetical protein DSC_02435 [Pseudoxanthomonas spadix BD-a59]|uniref:Sulfotransferase family protein n=1 Tax=Pseudoxanthomonas spadix (strain BD-a59) TaxID=1045855 RepID=G7UVM3_PSEUP|nr:hypothetical protein DSC_02435 [Pseudoxanthomonas spadix BD-a59]
MLVLGMHRSGTSAITRVLNLLGVPLGDDLLQAAEDNSKGFWEHNQAVAINEKLFAALDRHWHDIREMPDGWMEHPAALEAREEIAALVRTELGANRLWAVKDPRICRLAPLWLSVVAQEGAEAKAIVVARDPREVALSLQKRDGWTLAHSYLMWTQHLVEAFEATAGVARAMVTYDGLLDDWRGNVQRIGSELGLDWPVAADQASASIDAFITPSDHHHKVGAGHLPVPIKAAPLPPLLEALHARASSVAAGQLGWSALEELRGVYREAASIFSRPVAELVAERNELERLALERMDHINGLVIAKEIIEQREAETGAQLTQVRSMLHAKEIDITGLHVRVEEQAARIQGLALDQRELATLRGALDHEREYIDRAFQMADRIEADLRAQVQVLEGRLLHEQEVHAAAYARLAEAGVQLEAKILDRQAEVQHLREQMDRRAAEMSTLERQLVEKDAKLLEASASYSTHVERSAIELSAAEERNKELASEMSTLERQLVEKDAKLLEASAAYSAHVERSAIELSAAEERNKELASEMSTLERQLVEKDAKLLEASASYSAHVERSAIELSAAEERNKELTSEMSTLERQLVEKDAKLLEASAAYSAHVERSAIELSAAEERNKELASEMSTLERQLVEKDAKLLEASAAYSAHVERSAIELSAAEERNKELTSERNALARQVEAFEGRLARANDQVSRTRWLLGRAWRSLIGVRSGEEL